MNHSDKKFSLIRLSYIFLVISFSFCILASPFIFFMALSIAALIVYYIKGREYPYVSLKLHDIFLFFFLFIILLGSFFARNQVFAWEGFGVFCFYVLVYFFFRVIPLDKKKYERMVYCISFCLIAGCSFALLNYFVFPGNIDFNFFGRRLYRIEAMTTFENHPLRSIFEHPWRGGHILFMALTFVISFFIERYDSLKWRSITVFILTFVLAVMTLYLTYTRAPLISFIIVLFMGVLLTRKYIVIYLLCLITLFFIVFKNDKIVETMKSPLQGPNVQHRLYQDKAGLEMFAKNNILLGIGLQNFQVDFNTIYTNNVNYDRNWFIHDNYIAILVETGIFGFTGFFGFLITLYIWVIRNRGKDWNPVNLNAVTFLSVFFISSIFDAVFYAVPIGIFFWIIAGLAQNQSTVGSLQSTAGGLDLQSAANSTDKEPGGNQFL